MKWLRAICGAGCLMVAVCGAVSIGEISSSVGEWQQATDSEQGVMGAEDEGGCRKYTGRESA